MEKSKVYFTKDISEEGLIKIYEALNQNLKGKVAIKISTGEMREHNYLDPNLIKALVQKLNGTIVECNTAYPGKRMNSSDHWETIKGTWLYRNCSMWHYGWRRRNRNSCSWWRAFTKQKYRRKPYSKLLMLSHFKGHAMGGFGGALKNMSIWVASSNGKAWIHSVGRTKDTKEMWNLIEDQDDFLESMAEADKAVVEYFKPENMAYINVANKISIDCDCDSNPAEPEMKDIGIFASIDPVALDQCCYDTIINSNDLGKESLINRMKEKHAIHTVERAYELGIGNREYEIINIDGEC